MLTSQFNANESFEDFALRISKFKIDELVTHQLNEFHANFIVRSGKTAREIENVRSTYVSLDGFTLSYPLTVRYLDMRKSITGNVKLVHAPIYMRSIYGQMFGGRKSKVSKKTLSLNSFFRLKFNHTLTSILNSVEL